MLGASLSYCLTSSIPSPLPIIMLRSSLTSFVITRLALLPARDRRIICFLASFSETPLWTSWSKLSAAPIIDYEFVIKPIRFWIWSISLDNLLSVSLSFSKSDSSLSFYSSRPNTKGFSFIVTYSSLNGFYITILSSSFVSSSSSSYWTTSLSGSSWSSSITSMKLVSTFL